MEVTRRSRTSPPKSRRALLAKVLRELLRKQRFSAYVDLKDEFKRRCARLKVRPTPLEVLEALDLVESNTTVVTARPTVARREPRAVQAFTKTEAADMLARLRKAKAIHG